MLLPWGVVVAIRDLTVKERILLHLFEFYRLVDEYTVPGEVTQTGIAKGVGIRVQHVTQSVQPMIQDGMLEEHTRHIEQKTRRRKVYFLTTQGLHQAASLRKSLFKESVPFGVSLASVRKVPLSKVYREDRRGTSLPSLLVELRTMGFVRAGVGASALDIVDFTHEAPTVDQFYGRERELDKIVRAVEGSSVVIVTGMAGIGKTALGSKVCDQVRGTRSLFWRRIRPWDRAVDLAARLAGFLRALGRPRLDSHLSAVGEKQLGRIEEFLKVDLDGLDAVLVFDDVHGAREDALDFLSLLYEILGRRETCSGLLLSRTVPRFHSRRDVVVEKSAVEVSLTGLEDEPARRLLSEGGVPDRLWEQLLELSGANPLFLRLLARTGAAKDIDRAWKTLETYIAQEIEPSLSEGERACLEFGSFYVGAVPAEGYLLGSKGGTRSLVGLQTKGLLDPVGSDRFLLHDSLRDYFQKSLPLERRQSMSGKVLPWLFERAEAAEQRGAWGEATSLLENAMMFETESSSRFSALQRLGRLRTSTGDASGGVEAYRAALQLTTDVDERIGLHERIASGLSELGRFDEAEDEIETATSLLPSGPSARTARLLLKSITSIHVIRMDFERAWECVDCAARWMASLHDDPYLEGYLSQVRGLLFAIDPAKRDLTKAGEELRRAEEIWTKVSPRTVLWTYSTQVRLALVEGRPEDALAYSDRVISLARENSDIISRFDGLRWKAICLSVFLARFDEALHVLNELHELADTIQLPWAGYPLWDEATLYEAQGRLAEAREALAYFVDQGPRVMLAPVFSDEGHVRWIEERVPPDMLVYAWLAMLSAQTGDPHAAEDYLKKARKRAPENPSPWQASQLELAQALLHESLGQVKEAEAGFRRMMGHFNDMNCMDESLLFPIVACRHTIGSCLADYGGFLVRQGKRKQATEILSRVMRDSSGFGLGLNEHRARALLEAVPVEGNSKST